MAFTKPSFDTCAYRHELYQTIGPAEYLLGQPAPCKPCFVSDPHIRMQRFGASVSKQTALIDVDSELMGLTRKYSKCPEMKYIPQCNLTANGGANPGGFAPNGFNNSSIKLDCQLMHFPEDNCFEPVEDTRLSNPPATLRGTGFNRWEWLCRNPQERVLVPFDFNISDRTLAKDNHRPCVPNPLDQTLVLPTPSNEPLCSTKTMSTCGVPVGPPSVHWMTEERVKNR
jgi:hypothetical protein